MPIIVAAFLAAHGLIHLSFLAPTPLRTADGPEWPFELGRSWLIARIDVDPGILRVVGVALVAATVASFSAAALATIGWLAPSWWAGLVAVGASSSLITLALFLPVARPRHRDRCHPSVGGPRHRMVPLTAQDA